MDDDKRREITVSTSMVNIWGNISFIISLLFFAAIYAWLWEVQPLLDVVSDFRNWLLFIPIFFLGILLHEGLHGWAWAVLGRVGWKGIRFGVKWKALMPYTQCLSPIKVWPYRVGLILPSVVTGLVPAILGLVWGLAWLTLAGAYFLGVAVGDLMILWVTRSVPAHMKVLDHPERAGFFILE